MNRRKFIFGSVAAAVSAALPALDDAISFKGVRIVWDEPQTAHSWWRSTQGRPAFVDEADLLQELQRLWAQCATRLPDVIVASPEFVEQYDNLR